MLTKHGAPMMLRRLRRPPLSIQKRYNGTRPSYPRSNTRVILLGAVGVTSLAGGQSVQTADEKDEALRRIKHWEEGKRKRDEIEARHEAQHRQEMEEMERLHPGSVEHQRQLAERRAEMKKYEIKLVMDRHAMGIHHPGGKTKSWSELDKERHEKTREHDKKMLAEATRLKEELRNEAKSK